MYSTYVDDMYQYRKAVLINTEYDRGVRPSNITEVSVSFSLLSIKELVRNEETQYKIYCKYLDT